MTYHNLLRIQDDITRSNFWRIWSLLNFFCNLLVFGESFFFIDLLFASHRSILTNISFKLLKWFLLFALRYFLMKWLSSTDTFHKKIFIFLKIQKPYDYFIDRYLCHLFLYLMYILSILINQMSLFEYISNYIRIHTKSGLTH